MRMLSRVILALLFAVAYFSNFACERQKRMIPFSSEAINLMTKPVSKNISRTEEQLPCIKEKVRDCADLYKKGYNQSGIYAIWPINRLLFMKPLEVYCDMTTDGGGWTVIQRRGDFKRKDDYFYRDWESYKKGFGNVYKDFWLGNDNIYYLTNRRTYSVRFDLEDKQHNKIYAEYDKFKIDDESNKYTLHISDYSGTAGDAMDWHNKMKFTTKDKGNDEWSSGNCAVDRKGAWWYNNCYVSNLNGMYNDTIHGIRWETYSTIPLLRTEIKIRPMYFGNSKIFV